MVLVPRCVFHIYSTVVNLFIKSCDILVHIHDLNKLPHKKPPKKILTEPVNKKNKMGRWKEGAANIGKEAI
jgi:hypothetical protein